MKRAIQDLAGEETYARYIESLRVPDWVLLFFKTRGRISGHTWQTVINITQLGRTGVSKVFYSFIVCLFNNFFSRIFYLNKLRVALPVALRVAACRLGPVSRKPRKVFGPVKPFLVHFYLKTLETSCMKENSSVTVKFEILQCPKGFSEKRGPGHFHALSAVTTHERVTSLSI